MYTWDLSDNLETGLRVLGLRLGLASETGIRNWYQKTGTNFWYVCHADTR